MSLVVWLPLTKDLRNQGLDNVVATVGGTVDLTGAGKLGKCATIGTTSGGITLPASLMTSFSECSVTFWIKIISWNTSWATFFQAGLGGQAWPNYIFGILRNNNGSNLCFALTDANRTCSQTTYTTSDLNLNQWYHLAFVYKPGTINIYIDGTLNKSYSTTYVPNFAGITHISIGRCTNNSGYQTNCSLNDFRIYDHALSPMEVKEISKGLILHYPLNRQGWGQENLITNSQVNGSWTYPSSSYSDKYSPTTAIIPSGSTYTLSFDAKSTVAGDKVITYYYSPNTTTGVKTNQGYTSSASDGYASFTLTTDWKRYWVTYTQSSTTAVKHLICPRLTSGKGTGTVSVRNVKFEEGDKPTPWCPNSSDALATTMDLNGTIEYDCSGFCNNGTKWAYDAEGVISYTSNTPKYNVSTFIDSANNTTNTASGTRYIYGNCELTAPQYLTVAFWCKPIAGYSGGTTQGQFSLTNNAIGTSAGQDYNTAPMNHRDSSIDMCTSSGVHKVVNISFTANEWHYYVIVYDGRYGRVYKDGIATSATLDMGSILPLSDMRGAVIGFSKAGGVWRSNKSYYSDFRIYTTALSADDIKSLYQNFAYIDSSGNVYGAVHEEV